MDALNLSKDDRVMSELKTIKFQMMLSPAEADALDDWGFANRIKSRAEVIRRLCRVGLDALEQPSEFERLCGKENSHV